MCKRKSSKELKLNTCANSCSTLSIKFQGANTYISSKVIRKENANKVDWSKMKCFLLKFYINIPWRFLRRLIKCFPSLFDRNMEKLPWGFRRIYQIFECVYERIQESMGGYMHPPSIDLNQETCVGTLSIDVTSFNVTSALHCFHKIFLCASSYPWVSKWGTFAIESNLCDVMWQRPSQAEVGRLIFLLYLIKSWLVWGFQADYLWAHKKAHQFTS